MVYFYSDPHFYHENIIKYTNRPFNSVEDMNETLIKNWNNTVSKSDKVFVMGDFAFGNKEKVTELVNKLNGMIVLIMGNHDRGRTANWWSDCGFFQVIEFPIIYNEFFILSHEPVFINESMPYVNIHGHLHNNQLKQGYYYNICVELHDYKPISADNIINKFKKE